MHFIKNFKFEKEKGLDLTNKSEINDYLNKKIELFLNFENYSNKEKLLELLNDFLEMCKHDCKTANFNISEIESFKLFDIKNSKKMMIEYYDIVFMLGTIALNTFDAPGNRIDRVEDGISGPINTSNMFFHAYKELISCKENMKIGDGEINPYGANLIFATLLEKDLKGIVKREYVKEWLSKLKDKINDNEINFSNEEENELFKYLLFEYEIEENNNYIKHDSVQATTKGLYDLLYKYEIVTEKEEDLIKNKYTLNNFLKSSYSKKIEASYLKIIRKLFYPENLNLRNNLAHCNFGYLNYHHICVGSLLYLLYYMLLENYAIKQK